MHPVRLSCVVVACAIAGGCNVVSLALAPGAEQVKITRVPADVASCHPVGNVRHADSPLTDLRNVVVGLDGNTLFVTVEAAQSGIIEGIAYRCP